MADAGAVVGPSLTVLRLFGLWVPAASSAAGCGGAAAYVPGALSCVAIALLSLSCVSKLVLDTPTELTELTVCAYLFVIISANLVKAFCLLLQQGSLHELVALLAEAKKKNVIDVQHNEGIRRRYGLMSARLYRYLQVMIVVSSVAWLFVTVLFRVITAGSTNIDWPTPIPIWLPLDTQLSPTYELIYLAQVGCAVVTAATMLGVDTLFFHLTLMIVAELQVLNDNVSVVGRAASADKERVVFAIDGAGERQPNPSDGAEGAVSLSNHQGSATAEKKYLELIEIIQHHQIIIKMIGLLQTIMDYSVSVLILTNVLDMCFLIFTMSELLHHEKSLHAVLQTILSLPCLLCESGAFCMFGQMIIDQSENLVHAAFSCEWLDADSRFRKPLYTFMLMATHPLQIKLGGTAKLSRSTFLQALNGSYSLINLLYHSRRPGE